MRTDDLHFFILKYVSSAQSGPFQRVTFGQIKDAVMSSMRSSEFTSGSIGSDTDQLFTKHYERQTLEILTKSEHFNSYDSDAFVDYGDGISHTVTTVFYTVSKKGLALLKDIELNGRTTNYDIETIDYLLPYLPWHGPINLTSIKEIVKELGVILNIPIVERLLISYGFTERLFRVDNSYELILTEKGRDLKKQKSLKNFNEWEENERTKVERSKADAEALVQANILSGRIQESLLTLNKWVAFGTVAQALTAVILLFVGVLKNYYWVGSIEFWTSFFIFCLGVTAGIVILLIINRLMKGRNLFGGN